MAKRNEYPNDRSMEARMQCVRNALIRAGTLSIEIESFTDRYGKPDVVLDVLKREATALREIVDLAIQAMNGNDPP